MSISYFSICCVRNLRPPFSISRLCRCSTAGNYRYRHVSSFQKNDAIAGPRFRIALRETMRDERGICRWRTRAKAPISYFVNTNWKKAPIIWVHLACWWGYFSAVSPQTLRLPYSRTLKQQPPLFFAESRLVILRSSETSLWSNPHLPYRHSSSLHTSPARPLHSIWPRYVKLMKIGHPFPLSACVRSWCSCG